MTHTCFVVLVGLVAQVVGVVGCALGGFVVMPATAQDLYFRELSQQQLTTSLTLRFYRQDKCQKGLLIEGG